MYLNILLEKVVNHIALVGKGITFDTGGLCLRATNYMLDMKSDMAGSATVTCYFPLTHLPNSFVKNGTKVTGVLALAENGFGASSYKPPGDVLTAMNGTSVEVVDTDAEGRLALADALCYASSQKPDQIIDLATLTGSVVASLGEAAAGAMTNDEELLATLKASFDNEGENIWQMPLFDEYKDIIKSEIADLCAHCNTRPDASVAGIFLKEFVGDKSGKQIPWVHLDIAGMVGLKTIDFGLTLVLLVLVSSHFYLIISLFNQKAFQRLASTAGSRHHTLL